MVLADMLSRIVGEEELRQSSQVVVVVSSLEEAEVHSVLLEDKKLEDTLKGSHSQDLEEEVVVRSRQDTRSGHSEQNLNCSSASCWVEDRKDNQSKQMVEGLRIQQGCSSPDRKR